MIGCLPTYASISSQSYGATIFFWPPPQGLGTQVASKCWTSDYPFLKQRLLRLVLAAPSKATESVGTILHMRRDRSLFCPQLGQFQHGSLSSSLVLRSIGYGSELFIHEIPLKVRSILLNLHKIPKKNPWNTPSKSSL